MFAQMLESICQRIRTLTIGKAVGPDAIENTILDAEWWNMPSNVNSSEIGSMMGMNWMRPDLSRSAETKADKPGNVNHYHRSPNGVNIPLLKSAGLTQ